ncbi:RodZ domain-containing protein [Rheinheimera sp.]|uniref:RodZ domain-containing protein n=1 Tax=Rheinheimera sp. TaxID=1869214 RepID=UPI00307DBFF4
MTTELEQTVLTVGQCLKQAREQQQLTAQQVALQLNLKTSLIDDLEADRFDPKLSPTFYRGYLRSYAKLLKLPENALLEQYSKETKGLQQTPSLTRSFSKRTAKEATDSRYIWLTWLVVLSFIVLLVMYFWQNRLDGQPVSAPLPVVDTEQTAQQQEEQASAANWTNPEQNAVVADTTAQHAVPVLTDAVADTNQPVAEDAARQHVTAEPLNTEAERQPQQTDPVSAATVPQQNSEPQADAGTTVPQVNEEPQAPVTQLVQPAVSVPTDTDSGSANTPAALNSPVPEQQQAQQTENTGLNSAAASSLVLSFSGDCWVEITDASGKRLAFGARSAGDSLELSGVAPVKVLLGNASAAQLSFDGQPIDLSGYAQGRVARLTLGQ